MSAWRGSWIAGPVALALAAVGAGCDATIGEATVASSADASTRNIVDASSAPPPDAAVTGFDAAPAPDASGPFGGSDPDAAPPARPCEGGDANVVDPATGHCYEAFFDATTWDGAAGACALIDAHLAAIESEDENRLLSDLLGDEVVPDAEDPDRKTHDYWLGGRQETVTGDEDVDDGWVWVTGDAVAMSLTDSGWRSDEPNDNDFVEDGGEDCQILEADNAASSDQPDHEPDPGAWDATWDDRSCEDVYRYVCERE